MLPPLWTAPRRRRLALLVANGLAQAALGLGLVVATGAVLGPSAPPALVIAAGLLAVAFALGGLAILQARQAEAFALDVVTELRLALLANVLHRPADHEPPKLGPVMSRAVSDLAALRTWLASGLVGSVVAVVALAGILAGLAVLAPASLAALVPALGLFSATALVCSLPLARAIRRARRERGRLAMRIGDALPARLTHLHMGRSGSLSRGVRRRSQALAAAIVGRATWAAGLRAAALVAAPLTLATAVVRPTLTETGPLTAAETAIVLLVAGLVSTQLTTLARALELGLADREARRRLQQLCRLPTLAMRPDAAPFSRPKQGIELAFDDLVAVAGAPPLTATVAPGATALLRCVDPREGHRLALVIAGLAEPVHGSLRLGGRGHLQLGRRDWWRCVTLLSPLLPPVGRTVGEEAALGAPSAVRKATVDAVLAGLKLAPDAPLDVIPADAAVAARLRVARAVLRGAAVIVVDDPVVVATPQLVQRLVDLAREDGRTLVVVAPVAPIGVDAVWQEVVTPVPTLSAAG